MHKPLSKKTKISHGVVQSNVENENSLGIATFIAIYSLFSSEMYQKLFLFHGVEDASSMNGSNREH